MSKFKIGDKVRRINYDHSGMKVGDVGVVSDVTLLRGVRVLGVSGAMDIENMELVESAPADKEAELRAAYVQAAKDHAEAVVTLDNLRTEVWQMEDKEAHLRVRKQKVHNEFIGYIVEKEVPHV